MTRFIYNQKILRGRRRALRSNQTKPEQILWGYLSKKQLGGSRFCRQYGIGPYILDFYCPRLRLAIELDGETHETVDAKIYDEERSQYLQSLDINEIRFRNAEVLSDIARVVEKIKATISPLR